MKNIFFAFLIGGKKTKKYSKNTSKRKVEMITNEFIYNVTTVEKVIDGDTVQIDNFKIRLEGIDAPEMRQKCKREFLKISSTIGFIFYKDYNCGEVSKKKLKDKNKESEINALRN